MKRVLGRICVSGMDGFIPKPVDSNELVNTIELQGAELCEAIEIFRKQKFDVVFMDLQMP